MNYGTAYCKTCGSKFPVRRPRQIFCSPKCKRGWRNHLRRRHYWQDFEEINCMLECALEKLAMQIREFAHAKNEKEELAFLRTEAERLQKENDNNRFIQLELENAQMETTKLVIKNQNLREEKEELEWQLKKMGKLKPKPAAKTEQKTKQEPEIKQEAKAEAKQVPEPKEAKNELARHKKPDPQDTKRKCHDCGKPTTNYRCDECLQKWRVKNGLSRSTQSGLQETNEFDAYPY